LGFRTPAQLPAEMSVSGIRNLSCSIAPSSSPMPSAPRRRMPVGLLRRSEPRSLTSFARLRARAFVQVLCETRPKRARRHQKAPENCRTILRGKVVGARGFEPTPRSRTEEESAQSTNKMPSSDDEHADSMPIRTVGASKCGRPSHPTDSLRLHGQRQPPQVVKGARLEVGGSNSSIGLPSGSSI
jgi:hypothetical protein